MKSTAHCTAKNAVRLLKNVTHCAAEKRSAGCRKPEGMKKLQEMQAGKKQNFKETIVRRADVNNFIEMRIADMRMSMCAMCRQDIR